MISFVWSCSKPPFTYCNLILPVDGRERGKKKAEALKQYYEVGIVRELEINLGTGHKLRESLTVFGDVSEDVLENAEKQTS